MLLHPTSLPGPYGIGELGQEAFAFVDWLADAGMQCWQARACARLCAAALSPPPPCRRRPFSLTSLPPNRLLSSLFLLLISYSPN